MIDPILTYISHDDFVADIRAIAAAVASGEWTPDFLVAIGRGGHAPGAYLSHALDIDLLSIDHSAKVYCFGDQLLAELAAKSRMGVKLLIVDDINDSGATIGYMRDAIDGAGGLGENVRFAVLINNIRSSETVDYSARSIDRDLTKDWFVFPWEALGTSEAVLRDAAAVPERIG